MKADIIWCDPNVFLNNEYSPTYNCTTCAAADVDKVIESLTGGPTKTFKDENRIVVEVIYYPDDATIKERLAESKKLKSRIDPGISPAEHIYKTMMGLR